MSQNRASGSWLRSLNPVDSDICIRAGRELFGSLVQVSLVNKISYRKLATDPSVLTLLGQ